MLSVETGDHSSAAPRRPPDGVETITDICLLNNTDLNTNVALQK